SKVSSVIGLKEILLRQVVTRKPQERIVVTAGRIVFVDARHDVNLAGRFIDGGRAAAIPKTTTSAVRRVVEDSFLLQRGLVIGKKPAVVAMAESNVNLVRVGIQRQARALVASVL